MEKEIIEGNKMIAEFMGAEFRPNAIRGIKFPYTASWNDYKTLHYIEDLKFHSSWDWLMPVMEKIGQDYNVKITWTADGGSKGFDCTWVERPDIFDKELADFGGFGAMTNTWKCAVKFIQWYKMKNKKRTTAVKAVTPKIIS